MKPLDELIDTADSAIPQIREWIGKAVRPAEILPPSSARESALLRTQVTTRSPMGAVVYETGGILFDRGWLRFLGSGHPRLQRTLPGWNECRSDGFYLFADDAVGGFFAWNLGAFGKAMEIVFYLAPDSLRWTEMRGMGYSELLQWACTGRLDAFYAALRWNGWESDVATLHGDSCFRFDPPLSTPEGKGFRGRRSVVPVEEMWALHQDMKRPLETPGNPPATR